MAIDTTLVTEFLARAETGDRRGALARIRELVTGGMPVDGVLATLAATQYEVGLRWQAGMWTVAQEHAATAVCEAAVGGLPAPDPPPADAHRVAVVCGDGEWHVLPARLFAERLERRGLSVLFLGGSVPPSHLVETLPAHQLDAVAVSCTLSLNLPGAARTTAAAHACGLPALVGGVAVTGHPHRATAIGGDATPKDAAEAVAVLDRWQRDGRPALLRGRPRGEGGALLSQLDAIVTDIHTDLLDAYPAVRDYDEHQTELTLEDLAYHVRYLAAAEDIGDPSIYIDMVTWLTDLLLARNVPLEAMTATLEILQRVLTLRGFRRFTPVIEQAHESLLAP